MSQNLNPVQPTVRLDGEEISFESLVLEQSMNTCHRFEVVCEYMSQKAMWSQTPQKFMDKIGARVSIKFEHQDSGTPYEFLGWVTDVRIDAWESEPDYSLINHRSNRVHIIGEGDVVKLNGARGMDSFVDCQLNSIVTQSTQNGGIPLDCNPEFTGVIPYVMRYQESVFEFLNRLSSTYNEMFFFDGKTIHFGQPKNSSEVTLYFDHDVFSLSTRAMAVPHKMSAYDYIHESDKNVYAQGSKNSAGGLLSSVIGHSEQLFSDEEMIASASPVTSDSDLKSLEDKKSKTLDGSMLTIEGQTRTCQVVLGGIVEVLFPSEMSVPSMGRFRVISIVHKVDKSGNYSNSFVGTPEKSEYVTQQYARTVKAYPEMAVVSSNSDPKSLGRVQVQFEWQKRVGKNTNWIRVQSPDAGGSGIANRGLVFIPEEGDQVMVGFEYGDPNRPYVMGSLFSGSNGKGGGENNKVHHILTKSGLMIEFDDDSSNQGIIICDANGNQIHLQANNSSIMISANEDIEISAKNITLNASDSIALSSSKDFSISAGGSYKKEVEGNSTDAIGGNQKTEISGESSLNVKKQNVIVSKDKFSLSVDKEMKVKSSKDMSIETGGELGVKASKDGNITSGGKMNVNGSKNVFIGK